MLTTDLESLQQWNQAFATWVIIPLVLYFERDNGAEIAESSRPLGDSGSSNVKAAEEAEGSYFVRSELSPVIVSFT